jgi:hypothetical protein|tara:strand:+ start:499 stop:1755 length:1257 start_codon:yes stop_codon:yes gene_type:complete
MANVLKIKHRYTGSAGAPTTLARSELAYNEISSPTGGILYIGTGGESGGDADTKIAIGGPGAYTDLGSSQTVTNKDLTSTTNSFTAASATQAGVVELATDTETNAGSSTTRAVTPANVNAFTGSTNIATVGTISSGTWSGTALVAAKVPNLEALTVGGHIDVNAKRIGNLAAPVSANDAARKVDVDNAVIGLDVRDSVKVVQTANEPSLTGNSGAYVIDGVTLAAGDRVLLQNQSTASENGIYAINTPSGSTHSMSRASDLDSNDDCSANMFFFVEEGTNYADSGWVCTTNETVTLTNMTFSQFSGAGQITAGNGLDKTGDTLSVDLKTNGGIVIESTEMAVDLGASSITGTLGVADGGTGATSLTTGTVLLGNSTSAITQLAKQAAGKILTSEGTAGGDGAVWSNTLTDITMDCGTF